LQITDHQVDYVLIGGQALALHGFARGTEDIDLLLPIDSVNGQRGRGGKGGAKKQGPTCAACKKAKTVVLKTKAGKDWLKCEAPRYLMWVEDRMLGTASGGRKVVG
jgi:hypothetical protein